LSNPIGLSWFAASRQIRIDDLVDRLRGATR